MSGPWLVFWSGGPKIPHFGIFRPNVQEKHVFQWRPPLATAQNVCHFLMKIQAQILYNCPENKATAIILLEWVGHLTSLWFLHNNRPKVRLLWLIKISTLPSHFFNAQPTHSSELPRSVGHNINDVTSGGRYGWIWLTFWTFIIQR
jgi:hypothetical protein